MYNNRPVAMSVPIYAHAKHKRQKDDKHGNNSSFSSERRLVQY